MYEPRWSPSRYPSPDHATHLFQTFWGYFWNELEALYQESPSTYGPIMRPIIAHFLEARDKGAGCFPQQEADEWWDGWWYTLECVIEDDDPEFEEEPEAYKRLCLRMLQLGETARERIENRVRPGEERQWARAWAVRIEQELANVRGESWEELFRGEGMCDFRVY